MTDSLDSVARNVLEKIFESSIEGAFHGYVSDEIIRIVSKKLTNHAISYSDKTLRWVMIGNSATILGVSNPTETVIRTENFFIAEITKAIRTHGFLSHAMFFSRVPDYIPIILNDQLPEYSFRVQDHGKLGVKVLWKRNKAILGSPFSVSLASAVRFSSSNLVLVPARFSDEDVLKWLNYVSLKYPSFCFTRMVTKEGQNAFHFIKIDLEKEEKIIDDISKLSETGEFNLEVDYFNEPFLEKLRAKFPEDEISAVKTSEYSWSISVVKKEKDQAVIDLVNYIGMNPELGVLFWKKSGLTPEMAERWLEDFKKTGPPIFIISLIHIAGMLLNDQEKKIFTTLFSQDQVNPEDVNYVAERIKSYIPRHFS